MAICYTDEKNIQITLALLLEHGLRRIVVSPGSTNHTFVLSAQQDPRFILYSCVDERSAAYMACGIAEETGEAVVLSCTAATASRNYLPGLTEAFYRKLPILAITSTRTIAQVGQLIDQQIDRSVQPKDSVKLSVNIPYVKDDEDAWECELKINQAILELSHHGKGPVHINLPTRYNHGYNCYELPKVRKIERFMGDDKLPEIPKVDRIAVYIGAHLPMSKDLVNAIDLFCEKHNAVVFVEHNSGYNGKYGINYSLALHQKQSVFISYKPNLIIDMGEVASLGRMQGDVMWRLSEDGLLKDPYKKLQYVFEMGEKFFFDYYSSGKEKCTSYFESVSAYVDEISKKAKDIDLPFSNVYVAQQLSSNIPEGAEMHFGILNSLRSWNFFPIPKTSNSFANTGGYGIDGCLSSLIGASVVNNKKIYYGIFGDLCFFYDMNALGNRQIKNNIRILLVNNGLGEEFKTFFSQCYSWGDAINKYVAAEGHFGQKSPLLVKHYAEDLGFEYISASNKEEFQNVYKKFVLSELTDKPILFEVFTTDVDENLALKRIMNVHVTPEGKAKGMAKKVLGEKGIELVKNFLKN